MAYYTHMCTYVVCACVSVFARLVVQMCVRMRICLPMCMQMYGWMVSLCKMHIRNTVHLCIVLINCNTNALRILHASTMQLHRTVYISPVPTRTTIKQYMYTSIGKTSNLRLQSWQTGGKSLRLLMLLFSSLFFWIVTFFNVAANSVYGSDGILFEIMFVRLFLSNFIDLLLSTLFSCACILNLIEGHIR